MMVVLMATMTACANHPQLIMYSELPAQAQSFVQKYFDSTNVSYIEREREGFHYEYKVCLNDETEIEFDQKGNLQMIDCHLYVVPDGVVPELIVNYVQCNHPNHFIVEYEIEPLGHKVELNAGGLELVFDQKGQIIAIDN